MDAIPTVPELHDAACVAHVHSTYSDGSATIAEIAASARRNDAEVVLLTDHDTLEARRKGEEGWHGSVLILVGHEVTPSRGHFLAFGLETEVDHEGLSEAEICDAVDRGGGFGFAAHPFSAGSRISATIAPPHPWRALDHPGCTGIELWSLATDSAEHWRSPLEAVRFLRRPEPALDGPPPGHLAAWDRLCASRRTPAIGGLDAHQPGIRIRGRVRSPMPNDLYFGLLQTHVLTDRPLSGELERDRAAVYEALRAGRCFLSRETLAPGRGFGFWASGKGGMLMMGSEARAGEWKLNVKLPGVGRISLLRDGAVVADHRGERLEHRATEPGSFRVEVRRERDGREPIWILSNPIYLRAET